MLVIFAIDWGEEPSLLTSLLTAVDIDSSANVASFLLAALGIQFMFHVGYFVMLSGMDWLGDGEET